MGRLASVSALVAEDFILEIILCMSINESSTTTIMAEQEHASSRPHYPT